MTLKEFNVGKVLGFNHDINADYCSVCDMDLYAGCPLCVLNEITRLQSKIRTLERKKRENDKRRMQKSSV